VLYIDSTAAAIYEEDPDIDPFKDTYDALWNDVALSSKASAERITRELKEVKREMSQAAGQQRIWRKSTRSSDTGNGDCVEVACAYWRKSTRSASSGNGDCIEARPRPASRSATPSSAPTPRSSPSQPRTSPASFALQGATKHQNQPGPERDTLGTWICSYPL
jgi:hypothetical protein